MNSTAHWLFLAAAALLLMLQAALLPSGGVWITDNGNKYLILRNFVETGSAAMVNPAAAIDPDNRFFPDGGFHFQRHGGRMFSVYPEFFSILAAPSWMLFGDAGLLILPIAGTLAVLALFLALLRSSPLSGRQRLLLGGVLLLGTPFLFYSGTFWEMTLASVFPLAALLAARKRHFFAAGLLLGAGLWLREEFYLIAFCGGAATLIFFPRSRRQLAAFAAGFLAAAIPLWIWNFISYGHILGLHGALYYTHNRTEIPSFAGRVAGIIEGYGIYYLKFDAGWPDLFRHSWLLAVPMALLPVAGAFHSEKFRLGAAATALVCWAALIALLFRNQEIVMASGVTVGLITALPPLAGFFLAWRELLTRGPRNIRFLTLALLVYIVLLPPLLTRTDIGLIWGPRHFLMLMPLLLFLSFAGFARIGWLSKRRKFVLLFAVAGVALQLAGEKALFAANSGSAQAAGVIRAAGPEVVVSDVFFLPEQTPHLFREKKWLFVRESGQVPELLDLLRAGGVKEFTLILSPRFRRIDPESLRLLLTTAPLTAEPVRFDAPGTGFLELFIGNCRLQSSP